MFPTRTQMKNIEKSNLFVQIVQDNPESPSDKNSQLLRIFTEESSVLPVIVIFATHK